MSGYAFVRGYGLGEDTATIAAELGKTLTPWEEGAGSTTDFLAATQPQTHIAGFMASGVLSVSHRPCSLACSSTLSAASVYNRLS